MYRKWLFLLSLLFVSSFALAAEKDKEQQKQFGSYREVNLDLEVKAQHGSIRIYRIWQGDKQEWKFNPQHDDLYVSEEKSGFRFGRELAKEVRRGPKTMLQSGVTAYPGTTGTQKPGTAQKVPASVAGIVTSFGIKYCANEGDAAAEMVAANKDGYKWVTRIGRKWAQYSATGLLESWGVGNFRIGQVLLDTQKNLKGYADTNDKEVISIDRYPNGQIKSFRGYAGALVKYDYYPNGQLSDVTNVDGEKTHYDYKDGDIVKKTMGDKTGAPPGEEPGEETSVSISYYPSGEVASVQNDDGLGSNFEYQYNEEEEQYVRTERASGNRVTRITTDSEDGLHSITQNGDYKLRSYRLCEDTAMLDQHNRVTYVDRDAIGIIKKVVFPDGRELKFTHTAKGWPELGESWDSETKPWGLKKIVTPSGTEVDYQRDKHGNIRVATETDRNSNVRIWNFDYDGKGNRIKQRLLAGALPDDQKDLIHNWWYDNYGNVEWYEDVSKRRWYYKYNARGDIIRITSPDSKIWEFDYTRSGKLKLYKDPRGYEQRLYYSKRGLLRRFTEKYDTNQEATTKYFYNHRGLVLKVLDPLGNEWRYEYSDAGQLRIATDPEGKKESYGYDHRGRIKTTTDGNGVVVRWDYYDTAKPNEAPQVEVPFAPLIHITYPTYTEEIELDLAYRLATHTLRPTKGAARTTRYLYDVDGRLAKVIRPDQKEIKYTWDQLSRVRSVTAPGLGTTTIDYPNGELQVVYKDALGGKVVQDFNQLGELTKETRADNTSFSFQYNLYGNVEKYLSSEGPVHKFLYDDAQNLKQLEVYPNATSTTPLKTVTYNRNLRGDLLGYTDGTTTLTWGLDALGQLRTASTNYGSFTKTHSYSYYNNGLPKSFTDVAGVAHTYLFDNANNFEGVIIPNEGSINLSYNNTDWVQPKSITFPGGAQQTYYYDDLRRLDRIHSTDQANQTLIDYNYRYLEGSVIQSLQTEHGNYSYGYDDAYRVTSIAYPDTSTEDFTYDDFGNRQPKSGTPWQYDENGAVEDTGSVSFTYDLNGNRKTRTAGTTTTEYFYNESDRLIRVEKPKGTPIAKYDYDPFGRRLWKEVSGTKTYYYYTENGLAAELDSSGTPTRTYLFPPGSDWTTFP
ncbi:hypothetical protein OAO01_08150, partial [Oligoflexia bacterium]|nr:hypothetical protein [Oligoflexia bacterium]